MPIWYAEDDDAGSVPQGLCQQDVALMLTWYAKH